MLKKMFLVGFLLLNLNGAQMNKKTIVLAGGCFWGTQAYFKQIPGVIQTQVGYANSDISNPTYEQVCTGQTNAVEAVKIEYDEYVVDLEHVLKFYFNTIDPTSLNKQGNDVGSQYRTGIYYVDESDLADINEVIKTKQKELGKSIVVEILPLKNFYKAEEYHQDYLDKNPHGYCHVSFESLPKNGEILSNKRPDFKLNLQNYQNKDDATLKNELSQISYDVVKRATTERPHSSELNNEERVGIYVDITNDQPLFSSYDKFDAGCGWPSFTKPIDASLVGEKADFSHGMQRVEIRTNLSDSHLGHVFDDGPKDKGGLRYCINGAALKFIPKDEMEAKGYGYLIPYLDAQYSGDK